MDKLVLASVISGFVSSVIVTLIWLLPITTEYAKSKGQPGDDSAGWVLAGSIPIFVVGALTGLIIGFTLKAIWQFPGGQMPNGR